MSICTILIPLKRNFHPRSDLSIITKMIAAHNRLASRASKRITRARNRVFPGEETGRRKVALASVLRYQRGTRSRFSRHSKPLLEDCASSRGCIFFFFFSSFQPCVTRLSSPFNSTRETRIICGRDPLERNKETLSFFPRGDRGFLIMRPRDSRAAAAPIE